MQIILQFSKEIVVCLNKEKKKLLLFST